ncbi:MAG: hypothetical protein ACREPR_05740, partial [Brasilonema sp.]
YHVWLKRESLLRDNRSHAPREVRSKYLDLSRIYIAVKNLQATNADDSQILVEDFLKLSESSLNKVWLDPEEDEAWKDL